jgi:hypothetical protein
MLRADELHVLAPRQRQVVVHFTVGLANLGPLRKLAGACPALRLMGVQMDMDREL